QEGILTSAGVFLCGPTADIASWINTIELMDIEYYNFTTFVTIQNNSSFQFMDNGIIKYGYVTSFDDDLYIITTITEEAFIEGYSPTQVMLDASLIRSMIIIAIFFLFIIGYELMMIRLINKSRIQLMALSSSSSGGIVVVDFDETLPIQFGNEGFYLALGYTEKEIRDKFDMQLSRIIYEKDITFCENLITHLKTHDKGDFKIRLKTKQRGLIWVHLNCSHHLDHQDSITMVMLDITESKNLNTEIKSLISTIPGGVMRTSAENWKIIFASGSLATLLGYEEEEFKEKFTYFNECVHNYDLAYYLQAIGKQPDNLYLELRLLKKDGSIAWTIINATKMLHENNEAVYQSVVLDATYQKEVSVELKKELDRSKIVMEMIDEFICEYFVDENRLISSRRFAEIIGIDLIINNFRETISKMGIIHPDDLDSFYDIYRNLDQNQKEYRMDIRLRHQDGEYVWYMFKSASLYEDDNLYKIIVKLTDINEEKNKINSLMEISVRDSFTGVYNSGNIAKFVENYLSTKNQNLSHALLMLDIDNFKAVNDKYGHDIGDKLIKEYVNRLVQFFGSGGIIGRVGGDEFVVLIKDIQSDKVLGYVEKLKRKLWKEYQFDQLVLSFSTSFGIALYPQDGTSYSILFKKADIACYESKRHGKNTTRLFQEDMLSTSLPQDSICYESVESDDLLVNCINILEEHENVSQGIHEVLDRMAHYYYFDGVLIFQYHDETRQFGYTMGYTSNPSSLTDFEYTNQTYHIQSTLLQQLSSEALFFLNDPETIRDEFVNLYELLKKEKYHSCLMCGIQEAGMMKSVIAFTSYKTIEYPKYQEVTTLVAMSRLVISYVNRMHDKLTQSPDSLVFAEIFKEKEIQAYVIDEDTHQLVYISPWLNSEFQNAKINDYCYQALRGKTDVCEDCPLHMLGQKRSVISHRHDEATNRWLGVNASRLNWGISSHHRMIYTYDITSTIENVTLMDALTG
ncbi:MAG: diguanylate cyclase, partial [Bacilli bacterium]